MAPKIVYALQPFPKRVTKSIFLAGPTPRDPSTPSWRPQAIALLEELGYDGHVFVPETADNEWKHDYDDQVTWEDEGLNRADVVLFWVPRDLKTMPAFTTNVEFGEWFKSGKCVFGAPRKAAKVRYLEHKAEEAGMRVARTLKATVKRAFAKVGEGAPRRGGECHVPAYVWRHPSFQAWYRAQRAAGNRLDGARVQWASPPAAGRDVPFALAVHVKVWVASEGRHKRNEVIFERPDVSTVVALGPDRGGLDTEVVLVREFRSTAVTADGFVLEPPSGSSPDPSLTPEQVAVAELREETGIRVRPERLVPIGTRQLSATFSTHRAHVFALRLTEAEMRRVRARAGRRRGDGEERTYVVVRRVADLLRDENLDWSSLGIVRLASYRIDGR